MYGSPHRLALPAWPIYSFSVPSSPEDYRFASLDRMGDATELRRLERFSFAMYAAGLAAECMLRSFKHPDRPFDEHHDLVALFRACAEEKLGETARARLRGPIQTLHQLWLNNFRYKSEASFRRHLKTIQYYRRASLQRGADELKVACIELCDAAAIVVTVGEEQWRNP